MDRRNFIKSLAAVAAYAVLPKIAEAKVYPSNVYLPAGTEIREVETGDLICTVERDVICGEISSAEPFNWIWPAPKTGQIIGQSIGMALDKARDDFVKYQSRLTGQ